MLQSQPRTPVAHLCSAKDHQRGYYKNNCNSPSTKGIKWIINLTKESKDLYYKKYKTMTNEIIEDINEAMSYALMPYQPPEKHPIGSIS